MADFNRIAKIYDLLARLIFGDAIRLAQTCHLPLFPENGRLLIIGGGTGWILEEVVRLRPSLEIDYLEASEEMLNLSKARFEHLDCSRVRFLLGTEKNIPSVKYDMIVTNFFLDVFEERSLDNVMKRLKDGLSGNGIWLCTEFQRTGKLNNKLILWAMHSFFRVFSKLESKKLQDFESRFKDLGFDEVHRKEFFHDMIFSSVYQPTSR